MRSSGSEPAARRRVALTLTLDKPEPEPDFPPEPPRLKPARPAPTTELPLFVKGLADAEAGTPDSPTAENDQPLVKMLPAAARAPLAVRRTSEAPRPQIARVEAQTARKLGPFDHDLLEDLQRIEAKATGRPASGRARARRWRQATLFAEWLRPPSISHSSAPSTPRSSGLPFGNAT